MNKHEYREMDRSQKRVIGLVSISQGGIGRCGWHNCTKCFIKWVFVQLQASDVAGEYQSMFWSAEFKKYIS